MQEKLGACKVPIEIVNIDTSIPDSFFSQFKIRLLSADINNISKKICFEESRLFPILNALQDETNNSFDQLRLTKGIIPQVLVKTVREIM